MRKVALVTLATFTLGLSLLVGACSGDSDSSDGGGVCSCNWGNSCDEYSSGCAFTECESDGQDVKSNAPCSRDGAVATCSCPSEDYVVYYYDLTGAQSECEFFCDDGVFQEL